jgi:DNA anti-recombination protein RmuC
VFDAAEEIIKGRDRAKQVISITGQADEEFERFAENLDELSKQLVQMNKDYNLTRQEMDSFFGQVKKNRTAFLEKFVELRFQIKDLVTAEEWQAMHVQRE